MADRQNYRTLETLHRLFYFGKILVFWVDATLNTQHLSVRAKGHTSSEFHETTLVLVEPSLLLPGATFHLVGLAGARAIVSAREL